MKLTDDQKEKIAKADTMEEKKKVTQEAGIELTDGQLEGVAGGIGMTDFDLRGIYDRIHEMEPKY